MTLTVSDLLDEAQFASGAKVITNGPSVLSVVNQALSYFNTMHAWNSMVVPERALSLVAGQDFLELGSDVRDVMGLFYNQGIIRWFKWVNPERITELRALEGDDLNSFGGYYGAYAVRPPTTGGSPVKIVELYPNVSANEVDIFRMKYRALLLPAGTGLATDQQYIPVLPQLEPLVRRLVRIHAEAIYHRDGRDLETLTEELERSTMLLNLKSEDGDMQPELGITEGGVGQSGLPVEAYWWDTAIDTV